MKSTIASRHGTIIKLGRKFDQWGKMIDEELFKLAKKRFLILVPLALNVSKFWF